MSRPRNSTLGLVAVFLTALVTYSFVRPPAEPDPAPVVATVPVQPGAPGTVPSPVPTADPTPDVEKDEGEVAPSPSSSPVPAPSAEQEPSADPGPSVELDGPTPDGSVEAPASEPTAEASPAA